MSKSVFVVLALSLIGIVTHLLPHASGVTTVGAVSMLAAAYLPRHLVPIPVFASVLVSDFLAGGYPLLSMMIVYSGHLAAALAIIWLCRHQNVLGIAMAGLTNAVVFYLVSNLSPMFSGLYPFTLEGFALCYFNGLPFLLKGMLANLAFGGVAFSAIYLVNGFSRDRGGNNAREV